MRHMLLGLSILSVLLGGLCPQRTLAQARSSSVSLTVSIFNDASVPQSVSVAQERAVLIMHRAGISLVWLDCGTPENRARNAGCSAISFPQHPSIRLVCRAGLAGQDTFGQSFQDAAGAGSYAVVYFRTLQTSKAAEVVNPGELLGHVVAHELGHLLLGLNSHSANGLMSSVWQASELRQASQGDLFFTGDEGDRIRSRYLIASARQKKTPELLQASSGN